ncbi:MAG: RHS repeat-associated core domain-containing protein [Candidatus Altimarinota bacterium]
MDYYPFGSIRIDEQYQDFDETKKFTGHEFDDESGYYYAQARYYHSDIGRFVSGDPLQWRVMELMQKFQQQPQALNFYSYSINSPIVMIDTTGESTTDFGVKLSAKFPFIGSVSVSIGLAFGDDMSKGIIFSGNVERNKGTELKSLLPKGEASLYARVSNQNDIENLSGKSINYGGSNCISGVCGGITKGFDPNENQLDENIYKDVTLEAGLGAGADLSVGGEYSKVFEIEPSQFNPSSTMINAWTVNDNGSINRLNIGTNPDAPIPGNKERVDPANTIKLDRK